METNKHKIIFAHGKCISEDVLIAYANNTLSAKEKHVVEKHTLGCDMCADALEGIMMMKNPSQLKGITESLNKKIGGAGEERKPIVLWMDTRVRVAIAAGIALLIGLVFIFNNSLNGPGANDKTVSQNLEKKGETTDSSVMSLDERSKADSTANFEQDVKPGKELDKKRSENSGLVNTPDANGGPGWTSASHASNNATSGDELKSKEQREFKKEEAPAPPLDAQQKNLRGYYGNAPMDRSKSLNKKAPVEDGKFADKDSEKNKGADDGNFVSGKTADVSTVVINDPAPNTNDQSGNFYSADGDAKTDAPKKEEKEKIVSKDSGKKDKKKTSPYPEKQKPEEKSNKGGKDNWENVSAPPQSTTVTGGSVGNVSPNVISQTTKTEQEVTLSKNKQVSDEEFSSTQSDTTKFDARLDSVSKGGLGSGEKKYSEKDYNGAIIVFAKTLETKPTDREALYKLGDSYLQVNKPDLAITQFDKLITMGKGAYYDAARYDKSQALLKQKKSAEAKKLLLEIESTSTEYKSRAKVQLDQIK